MKALLTLFTAILAVPALAADRPEATVETGKLAGISEGDLAVFKGIPYAAPPVGPLRWRPPVAAVKWEGVRDAGKFGNACPQPARTEPWARVGATSEDCLFLNVWRPAKPGRYPVMVFVHGGSFTFGAAGVPLYDGAKLARRGVVVVTLNYRLGLLGFFAHPALTKEAGADPVGNYGIMDQAAALRWVRRNIAAFGGDPGNVTLFGESAGAGSVQLLMASPAGRGLFHKAASQSGAGGSVLASLAEAEALGTKLAEMGGMANATPEQLRAVPANKLLARSFPFIDGKIVQNSPGNSYRLARAMKIPLIIGANSNEATLASNNAELTKLVLGDRTEMFARAYIAARPGGDEKAARIDLAEDALSLMPSMSVAVLHAANGAPAWDYYFTQVPVSTRATSAGSGHGDELQYLFGNPYEGITWDAADEAVSRAMGDQWVRFARTGDPNGKGMAKWPRVDAGGLPRYLVIGTPTAAKALTPLEEDVRKTSLAASTALWTKEP